MGSGLVSPDIRTTSDDARQETLHQGLFTQALGGTLTLYLFIWSQSGILVVMQEHKSGLLLERKCFAIVFVWWQNSLMDCLGDLNTAPKSHPNITNL